MDFATAELGEMSTTSIGQGGGGRARGIPRAFGPTYLVGGFKSTINHYSPSLIWENPLEMAIVNGKINEHHLLVGGLEHDFYFPQ